ncbi:hypothetical protein GCM10009565_48580 [Amycolatopsis albidoflavus]
MMIWYPPVRQVGPPAPQQFRTGSQTDWDWATVAVLDCEPGVGGLQVSVDGQSVGVPYLRKH